MSIIPQKIKFKYQSYEHNKCYKTEEKNKRAIKNKFKVVLPVWEE